MLEKIGLPPKPSIRGNTWVVDASHCQGCSSQFTFINRKHHCRRCGGLFCGSCTTNRMALRGQGDSPVRICEPCKNLEEAARFEMRYGHKNRAGKGGSKLKDEDDVLNQILGGEHKQSLSSKSASSGDMVASAEVATRSASSSSSSYDTVVPDFLTDGSNVTPEELRQQALEEKKRHKTLKSEGKPEEALKAFKRGKELERQAGALEIHLRKIRRKASSSSSHISEPFDKIPSTKNKDKDDIASELKDLGWSDMDLHDSDKKPVKLSVESELYSLIGEVSEKPRKTRKANGPDRSEVIAHKKKALELKREGKLPEAKEELKKAKILEKQIEEQELLGDDDDDESDDELSALIRSMDEDRDDELIVDVDPLISIPDDIGLDNLDVTEDDMEDPDLAAEMISLGWKEETTYSNDSIRKPARSTETMLNEIQSLKKEALSHKRAGNNTEALSLFKKAKMLEKDLNPSNSMADTSVMDHEPSHKSGSKSRLVIQKELLDLKKKALALRREGKSDESDEMLKKGKHLEQQLQEMENNSNTQTGSSREPFDNNNSMITDVADEEDEVNDQDLNDPTYLSLLKNMGWEENDHIDPTPHIIKKEEKNVITDSTPTNNNPPKVSKKSKGEIQRELLGLKRKYRTLRQQGQNEEAEEMLEMAKVLETQLADFETPLVTTEAVVEPVSVSLPALEPEETVTTEKTPQNEVKSLEDDIIAHKRKAISLKREGKLAEAKEELKHAKLLEKQMQENSTSINTNTLSAQNDSNPNTAQKSLSNDNTSNLSTKNESSPIAPQKPSSSSNDVEKDSSPEDSKPKTLSSRDRFKLQRECLNHKRQSLKLRREGKTQEAEAEFELAKELEAQLEESDKHDSKRGSIEAIDNNAMVDDFLDPQLLSALKAIGINDTDTTSSSKSHVSEAKSISDNKERKQFEEEIKAEKIKALNFKKAGKQSEALDALRRAKGLEKKMNSLIS